jgi:hypothetical protein
LILTFTFDGSNLVSAVMCALSVGSSAADAGRRGAGGVRCGGRARALTHRSPASGGLGSTIHGNRDRWCELPTKRTTSTQRGWSVYGAQKAQPVAISGRSLMGRNQRNKPNSLPGFATACRGRQIGTEASTVRPPKHLTERPASAGQEPVPDRFCQRRRPARPGAPDQSLRPVAFLGEAFRALEEAVDCG